VLCAPGRLDEVEDAGEVRQELGVRVGVGVADGGNLVVGRHLVRAEQLLIGKAIPVFAVLLLQQAVVIGYGVAAAGLSVTGPPFLLLLAMLAWSMTLLAAGSLLATLVTSHSQLAVLTDTGAIVISTLGGVLLPLSMMPAIARHAAPASPGYWAISMLKAAIRGDTAGTLRPAAVLGAIAVTAGTTACLRLRRGLAPLRS
jgi:ABC-2 type transport system permease protein